MASNRELGRCPDVLKQRKKREIGLRRTTNTNELEKHNMPPPAMSTRPELLISICSTSWDTDFDKDETVPVKVEVVHCDEDASELSAANFFVLRYYIFGKDEWQQTR